MASLPLSVSTPRTAPFIIGLVGVVLFAAGLYLLLIGLPRDYPLRLNGWAFLILGAMCSCAGLCALLFHSPYLVLDATGLHIPKHKLFVPWREIEGVREVSVKGNPRFLVLSLSEPEKLAPFRKLIENLIEKLKFDLGSLGEKEVPFPFFGNSADFENVSSVLRDNIIAT